MEEGEDKMAISGKYGKVTIPRIGENEPVFILRAQDQLAAPAIEMYKLLTASHDRKMAASLDKEAEKFRYWSGNKKLPD
jgi:hypothetical protein